MIYTLFIRFLKQLIFLIMQLFKSKFYIFQLIAVFFIIFSLSSKESIHNTVYYIINIYILLIMILTIVKHFWKQNNS